MTQPTDYERALRAEIAAIRRIVAALDKLDAETQQRIVRYLVDRYEINAATLPRFFPRDAVETP